MQSDERRDPLIGQTVAEHYRITERLGAGGMGSLYKAINTQLEQPVALKFINRRLRADAKTLQRLRREAQVLGGLEHPNIIAVKSLHVTDNTEAFLVLEYLEGETLGQFLEREGALNAEQFRTIFSQVCAGLSYAHKRGIVHRDVKPDNIMLLHGENSGLPFAATNTHVKLLDFGLAKLTDGSGQKLTSTGTLVGSLNYISPEQCTGGKIDERADIYSLACVMWNSLTGQVPFNTPSNMMMIQQHMEQSLPPLPPGHSRALSNILQRCTSVVPDNRLSTVDEMWRTIESDTPITVTVSRKKVPMNRRSILVGSAIAIALAIAAGGMFVWTKIIPDIMSKQERREIEQHQRADFALVQQAIAKQNYDDFLDVDQRKMFKHHEMTSEYAAKIADGLAAWIPSTREWKREALIDMYIDHCMFVSEEQQNAGRADLALSTVRHMLAKLHDLGADEKLEYVLNKEIGALHVAHRQYYIAGILYEDAVMLQRKGEMYLAQDRFDAGWASVKTLIERYVSHEHTDLPTKDSGKTATELIVEMADQNNEALAESLKRDKKYARAAAIYQEWLDYMDKLHLVSPIRRDRVQESRDLAQSMADKNP